MRPAMHPPDDGPNTCYVITCAFAKLFTLAFASYVAFAWAVGLP